MTAPRCAAFIAASVDGYIARPDGGIHWLTPFQTPGEDYGYAAFFASVDALVIGRATYELVLGFGDWPYRGKRCVVLTHRPAAPRHGEEPTAEAPGALVERLGREGVRRVYVDGGNVIQQFLAADLLDELTLSVIPIVLGDGIRLFGAGPERRLALQASQAYPSGLVQLRYRRDPDM